MKRPRLLVSDAAVTDILEQADWYVTQSGQALAKRWEKAVTTAVLGIVNVPAAGTPCTFRSKDLRDVRRTIIGGFPKHLLFYRFRNEEVLVLRIVHGARDLEDLL